MSGAALALDSFTRMMNNPVMLDSSPLGRLAHRSPHQIDLARLIALDSAGAVLIPEIADYEVRRSLMLHNLNCIDSILGYFEAPVDIRPDYDIGDVEGGRVVGGLQKAG